MSVVSNSQRRLARINEFMQLAIDVIISEQYPEYRDRIIANADRRLEQYHAVRDTPGTADRRVRPVRASGIKPVMFPLASKL